MGFPAFDTASAAVVRLAAAILPWAGLVLTTASLPKPVSGGFAARVRAMRLHLVLSLGACGIAALWARSATTGAPLAALCVALGAGAAFTAATSEPASGRLKHAGWLGFGVVALAACLWPAATARPAVIAAWILVRHYRVAARLLAEALADLAGVRAALVSRACEDPQTAADEILSTGDKAA